MKLSEFKNEDAIEVLADLIEPCINIFTTISGLKDKSMPKMKLVKIILKSNKSDVLEILAVLDGKPVEEYECNILSLPIKLMEIINDKDLLDFFGSQGLNLTDEDNSGSVSENTEEIEEA